MRHKGIERVVKLLEIQGLYPDFHVITDGVNEPICTVGGKQYLMFSSNNYLGLTQNEEVKEAAKRAIDKYGVGPGGSRVISGNVDVIEELEQAIADLVGAEACLTFPTGYMANVAVFRSVMDTMFFGLPVKTEDSVIFSDEYNHGSIVDGIKLSKARKVIFKHNDIEDLKQKIAENNLKHKLIVTEGVFSLEGEIINLPDYVEVAKNTGAKLMIDDAHGVGILGERGGGTPQLQNCADKIDIIMGCMDKAFGGTGGYLCGSKAFIKYLRISARSSLLSSAYPTVAAAAMLVATRLIAEGKDRRESAFAKATYLREKLIEAGFECYGKDVLPAIALRVGSDKKGVEFSRLLWKEGIFCIPFRWPAVAADTSRLRITVMSTHTEAQLDQFIASTIKVGKRLKLI